MKIVVDTNVVFSAILNKNSRIANLLLHPKQHFAFYTCDLLRLELARHKLKILAITNYSEAEYEEIRYSVTRNIHFIDHTFFVKRDFIKDSQKLLKEIDPDDAPFIALAQEISASLWTGDQKLIKGLLHQGYQKVFTTEELLAALEK